MAKKARVRHLPRELTRKQISRLERERRMERALIISVIALAVIVVGVLATGLIIEHVVKARAPVAVVNGVPIRAGDFQARARFIRVQLTQRLAQMRAERQSVDTSQEGADYFLNYLDGQITQLEQQLSLANAQAIGEQALDSLILYELARQEADRRGIVVTEDEVQRDLELGFGYDRSAASADDASATPSATEVISPAIVSEPTATPISAEEFQARYEQVLTELLKPNKISERQYRSWVAGDLLVERLREAMAAELPAEQEQFKLRLLTVQDEQLAQELAARLDAGESMDTFSEEFEAAQETPGYVTELEWFPRGLLEDGLGTELTELAFTLPVGAHSSAFPSPDGGYYYIIEVLGREVRPLDEAARKELANRAFEAWFTLQKETVVEYRDYQALVPTEP